MKKINFEFVELKSLSGKSEVANVKETHASGYIVERYGYY